MGATESKYTILMRAGLLKWKAEIFDENKLLVAKAESSALKGEISHRRNVQIEFLPYKTRQKLIRHGLLRKWYQLMDESGNQICHSIPKAEKYPLTLYSESDTQWLRVEKLRASGYVFYDAKNVEVVWMNWKRKGAFSRGEYELKMSQLPSESRNNIIAVAAGLVLLDVADVAAEAASVVSLSIG